MSSHDGRTLDHMAPELFFAQDSKAPLYSGVATDSYALGVTLYTLLVGTNPMYIYNNKNSTKANIRNTFENKGVYIKFNQEEDKDLDPTIKNLIRDLTDPDPKKRLKTTDANFKLRLEALAHF